MRVLILCMGFFLYSGAHAQGLCREIFQKKTTLSTDLQDAILRGIEVFDQQIPWSSFGDQTYWHGTHSLVVDRESGSFWRGTSIDNFPRLREFAGIYPHHSVLHVYEKKEALSRNGIKVRTYAGLSSQRQTIIKTLGWPSSFYDNPLFYELLDSLSINKKPPTSFLKMIEEEGVLIPWSWGQREWAQFAQRVKIPQGIVVVIDASVAKRYPVERDPEDSEAKVIIGKKGLPVRYIRAIIPLSNADRESLLRTISP